MLDLHAGSSDLAGANDVATLEELRSRGRIVLPDVFGRSLEFDLTAWYRDRSEIVEEYWRFHPRYIFLKNVPREARLVDLGAGAGGLASWRFWGSPHRGDVSLYGVDLQRGECFDQYVDYDLVDLGNGETKFPGGLFDAGVCSHLLPYVENRRALAREIARICRTGARVYVEVPSEYSKRAIRHAALDELGIRCGTLNVADDPEQSSPMSRVSLEAQFVANGFRSIASGEVVNDFTLPELLRCGLAENDAEVTTYALGLVYRTTSYLVVEKK